MRVTGNVDTTNAAILNKSIPTNEQTIKVAQSVEDVVKQGSEARVTNTATNIEQSQQLNNDEETKAKVQDVVEKMNKMLEVNHNSAKFKYHEGLDRYYVTVVNRDTDEVVKEIPPKKLLDAFYEMQKMFGMIVDEKI
ncbi:flagellar protein FlaG [Metasolibacillus meyeri]|uniref:Flagellar protein FlaG n=1 Tax=Metasolibacillus meyeri TaxID=1071052 RepID=A0AAW9NU47_9BACL|nr:flagellar protein FlaG [Metasolibacillus meyeri]MEC1178869.1 flagellar protein FlaG [Metasolibacillus meyeri]